jgi:hypothetical protein
MARRQRRSSEPAAAEAQEAGSCSDQELEAAGLVDAGGTLMAGLAEAFLSALEARGIDVRQMIETAIATVLRGLTGSRTSSEENERQGWEYARGQLRRWDFADMPYVRVVGRVAEILLNHRRFETCTIGDVIKVFLVEIPEQLEAHHRPSLPTGQQLSVDTADAGTFDGKKTFANRMAWLCEERLLQPTSPPSQGTATNYVLTENGQNMFDGWPPLSEIPGLELDGPVQPDSRA